PRKLNMRVYVGKVDWIIDAQSRHTVSYRGTLSNNDQTQTVAPFPGQDAASQLLSNNRGFGARYTAVLTPSAINVVNVGLTRIGVENTGTTGPGLTIQNITSPQNFAARARSRISPNWNFTDDFTWTKSRHTLETGINFRFVDNNLISYANAWPTFSGAHLFLQ